ncbi:MAG: FtsK/SpoIIIE domain-containing protein [Campylobacterota bacterium]|nr:FtsK/SpoIIIE domain-containing protein [Campylobacterota bacterium]
MGIKITANIQKRELLKQFNQLISEKFEARFFDLITWRIAFMLSLKNGILEQDLKDRYSSDGIGHQNISQDVSSIADEDTKFIFINLLSIMHSRKIGKKEDFTEMLKLHCRHGFDILQDEIEDIGINDNIIDFFINQLEIPTNEHPLNNDENINLIDKFKKALRDIQAPLKFIEEKSFDRVKKLYFDIEDLTYATTSKLYGQNLIIQLETATSLRNKIYIQQTKQDRMVSINIINENQPIYIYDYENEINNNDLSFIVGMDDEDNIEKANLIDLVHVLVAGTTGSGKTVFLHSLIYQLMKKDIELYLIDGKNGFEFGKYGHNANVVIDNEEIVPTINSIIDSMEDRYSQNIIEQSKPIIVVVDEFVDLIMQKKIIEDLFVRLAQKGRGAKIHLVLATQRPDSNILKGVLRSNIPSRIAFKVQKSTESKIILDETGAEELFGKGDMLFSDGKEIKRLQGFLSE